MMVILALCAAGVSVDRFSNRLSVFNVMEQIPSPGFPAWVPELTFVVVLRKENDENARFQTRCQVQLGDAMIVDNPAFVDFEGTNNARLVLNFQGLPVPSPGNLTFRLLLPNHEPAEVTIPVIRVGGNVIAQAAPIPPPATPDQ
jgi:hypothetical protein